MDVSRLRQDFPALRSRDIVYLDSACQTLKPQPVIDAVTEYLSDYPACGGRSVHRMANRVSVAIDKAREDMASFLGAKDSESIVFTKNCTESLNLVAKGLDLQRGDVVLTTDLEHNSNHAPWVDLCERFGVVRRIVPTLKGGVFDMEAYEELLDDDVKLVSMAQTSNVTGTTIPVIEVTGLAHDHGALVMIDGAQAAPHMPVDVGRSGVDFYTLSAHKMLGPSGVGALYGKKECLELVRPLMVGGGTVGVADYDMVHLGPIPERFEAGLGNYAGIIGTSAAIRYIQDIGIENIQEHEVRLQRRIQSRLDEVAGISLIGPDEPGLRSGVFSFNIPGLGSHDVAMIADEISGVLIRSGMHCVHPYFRSRGIPGCARASMYIYNDDEDIDVLMDTLSKISSTFSKR